VRIAANRLEKVCRRNHRPAAALLNKVEKGMQDRFLIRNRKIEVAAKRRPDAGARLYLANQYLNVMLRWHRTKRIKAANLRFVADQRSEAMRPVRMIRKPLGVIFFPTGLRAKDLGRGEVETGIARDRLALRCAIGEDALDRGDRLLDVRSSGRAVASLRHRQIIPIPGSEHPHQDGLVQLFRTAFPNQRGCSILGDAAERATIVRKREAAKGAIVSVRPHDLLDFALDAPLAAGFIVPSPGRWRLGALSTDGNSAAGVGPTPRPMPTESATNSQIIVPRSGTTERTADGEDGPRGMIPLSNAAVP
jgi:hypothetical protein